MRYPFYGRSFKKAPRVQWKTIRSTVNKMSGKIWAKLEFLNFLAVQFSYKIRQNKTI